MKKLNIIFLSLLLAGIASNVQAKRLDKSLGIIAGTPTGISAKYWLKKGLINTGNTHHAFDAAIGWKFTDTYNIHMKLDYTVHQYGVIPVEMGKLPVYYGMGARLLAGNRGNIGVRIPVGVNYLFQDEPFEGFMELAPVLALLPESKLELDIAIGARYRFY